MDTFLLLVQPSHHELGNPAVAFGGPSGEGVQAPPVDSPTSFSPFGSELGGVFGKSGGASATAASKHCGGTVDSQRRKWNECQQPSAKVCDRECGRKRGSVEKVWGPRDLLAAAPGPARCAYTWRRSAAPSNLSAAGPPKASPMPFAAPGGREL